MIIAIHIYLILGVIQVTSKEDKHSVLISRPNVLFFKLDLPSYS